MTLIAQLLFINGIKKPSENINIKITTIKHYNNFGLIMLIRILLYILIAPNFLVSCGCDLIAEIEKIPNRPNPAFWTDYQSDCPYYL
jgi:hypothetical protein